MTTAADCDILFSEFLADSVEVRIVGKYEREYGYPIFFSQWSDYFYLFTFHSSLFPKLVNERMNKRLFVFPDFFHASDGFDVFKRFSKTDSSDDIRSPGLEFVGISC